MFEPIAIVGRGCVLPGALGPTELGVATREGRDLISTVPPGRWRLPLADVLDSTGRPDHACSARGGYVEGFGEAFDPEGFLIGAERIRGLDPVFQWLLHSGREALRETGGSLPSRAGAVVGNLSFPSASMNRFAEEVWLGRERTVPPENRFTSGLPALLLADALGLSEGAFSLDAACASSLYAIKLACDALSEGQADLMLAGAVNCTDDLFIHIGFTALQALSPSGRSRPFHSEADGLVPAEGAALLALMRLSDALEAKKNIHGVIRGIGLSNDGRGQGLLVPSSEGQQRAIRAAYEAAGLSVLDVDLLECHATGTQVGDATEVASMAALSGRAESTPIASLKSNLGHLITTAGAAGAIKVLEAMKAGVRPPLPPRRLPFAGSEGGAVSRADLGRAVGGPPTGRHLGVRVRREQRPPGARGVG